MEAHSITRHEAAPAGPRDDAEVLEAVRSLLLEQAELGDCTIHPDGPGAGLRAAVLFPEGPSGFIQVSVASGVVTLEGEIDSLAKKAVAGALASRATGCRRVVNALSVTPAPEPSGHALRCAR